MTAAMGEVGWLDSRIEGLRIVDTAARRSFSHPWENSTVRGYETIPDKGTKMTTPPTTAWAASTAGKNRVISSVMSEDLRMVVRLLRVNGRDVMMLIRLARVANKTGVKLVDG